MAASLQAHLDQPPSPPSALLREAAPLKLHFLPISSFNNPALTTATCQAHLHIIRERLFVLALCQTFILPAQSDLFDLVTKQQLDPSKDYLVLYRDPSVTAYKSTKLLSSPLPPDEPAIDFMTAESWLRGALTVSNILQQWAVDLVPAYQEFPAPERKKQQQQQQQQQQDQAAPQKHLEDDITTKTGVQKYLLDYTNATIVSNCLRTKKAPISGSETILEFLSHTSSDVLDALFPREDEDIHHPLLLWIAVRTNVQFIFFEENHKNRNRPPPPTTTAADSDQPKKLDQRKLLILGSCDDAAKAQHYIDFCSLFVPSSPFYFLKHLHQEDPAPPPSIKAGADLIPAPSFEQQLSTIALPEHPAWFDTTMGLLCRILLGLNTGLLSAPDGKYYLRLRAIKPASTTATAASDILSPVHTKAELEAAFLALDGAQSAFNNNPTTTPTPPEARLELLTSLLSNFFQVNIGLFLNNTHKLPQLQELPIDQSPNDLKRFYKETTPTPMHLVLLLPHFEDVVRFTKSNPLLVALGAYHESFLHFFVKPPKDKSATSPKITTTAGMTATTATTTITTTKPQNATAKDIGGGATNPYHYNNAVSYGLHMKPNRDGVVTMVAHMEPKSYHNLLNGGDSILSLLQLACDCKISFVTKYNKDHTAATDNPYHILLTGRPQQIELVQHFLDYISNKKALLEVPSIRDVIKTFVLDFPSHYDSIYQLLNTKSAFHSVLDLYFGCFFLPKASDFLIVAFPQHQVAHNSNPHTQNPNSTKYTMQPEVYQIILTKLERVCQLLDNDRSITRANLIKAVFRIHDLPPIQRIAQSQINLKKFATASPTPEAALLTTPVLGDILLKSGASRTVSTTASGDVVNSSRALTLNSYNNNKSSGGNNNGTPNTTGLDFGTTYPRRAMPQYQQPQMVPQDYWACDFFNEEIDPENNKVTTLLSIRNAENTPGFSRLASTPNSTWILLELLTNASFTLLLSDITNSLTHILITGTPLSIAMAQHYIDFICFKRDGKDTRIHFSTSYDANLFNKHDVILVLELFCPVYLTTANNDVYGHPARHVHPRFQNYYNMVYAAHAKNPHLTAVELIEKLWRVFYVDLKCHDGFIQRGNSEKECAYYQHLNLITKPTPLDAMFDLPHLSIKKPTKHIAPPVPPLPMSDDNLGVRLENIHKMTDAEKDNGDNKGSDNNDSHLLHTKWYSYYPLPNLPQADLATLLCLIGSFTETRIALVDGTKFDNIYNLLLITHAPTLDAVGDVQGYLDMVKNKPNALSQLLTVSFLEADGGPLEGLLADMRQMERSSYAEYINHATWDALCNTKSHWLVVLEFFLGCYVDFETVVHGEHYSPKLVPLNAELMIQPENAALSSSIAQEMADKVQVVNHFMKYIAANIRNTGFDTIQLINHLFQSPMTCDAIPKVLIKSQHDLTIAGWTALPWHQNQLMLPHCRPVSLTQHRDHHQQQQQPDKQQHPDSSSVMGEERSAHSSLRHPSLPTNTPIPTPTALAQHLPPPTTQHQQQFSLPIPLPLPIPILAHAPDKLTQHVVHHAPIPTTLPAPLPTKLPTPIPTGAGTGLPMPRPLPLPLPLPVEQDQNKSNHQDEDHLSVTLSPATDAQSIYSDLTPPFSAAQSAPTGVPLAKPGHISLTMRNDVQSVRTNAVFPQNSDMQQQYPPQQQQQQQHYQQYPPPQQQQYQQHYPLQQQPQPDPVPAQPTIDSLDQFTQQLSNLTVDHPNFLQLVQYPSTLLLAQHLSGAKLSYVFPDHSNEYFTHLALEGTLRQVYGCQLILSFVTSRLALLADETFDPQEEVVVQTTPHFHLPYDAYTNAIIPHVDMHIVIDLYLGLHVQYKQTGSYPPSPCITARPAAKFNTNPAGYVAALESCLAYLLSQPDATVWDLVLYLFSTELRGTDLPRLKASQTLGLGWDTTPQFHNVFDLALPHHESQL